MPKNPFVELADEKLIKRKDLLKGILIGIGIVWLLIALFFAYIFITRGFKNNSFIILIPLFTLPVTLLPTFINLNFLNKEIKSRNLK